MLAVDKARQSRASSSKSLADARASLDMSLAIPFVFLSLASSPTVCVDADAAAHNLVGVSASASVVLNRGGTAAAGDGGALSDSALIKLYESGDQWESFLGAARARRDMWVRHATQGVVPADAVARARALPGRWRLLVVAVDACSDSVNTIPFLARLVASVAQLEMRVITPDAGRTLMEARRTPDGRAATPTVILLNEAGDEVGCWIERPTALQTIAIESRAAGTMGDFVARKAAWYESDAGASTINEVVSLLEKAAAGAQGCDAGRGAEGL